MQPGGRVPLPSGIPPVWCWAAAWFAAAMVLAPEPDIRHPDDYRCLEASVQAAQGGGQPVAQIPDARPGTLAPALGCWPQVIGFKAFGYAIWSARLPNVLAGALTVWLIGWLGVRLAGRDAGRLAAMLTAACLPWLAAALRFNPDVWLALFCTVAAGGFLLRLGGRRSYLYLWLGWTGTGLAVLFGGPAALLVLPPVYLASLAVHRDAWRRLVHWPALAACAALGLGRYLAVALTIGPAALAPFVLDPAQVTLDGGQVARRAGAHLVFMLMALLPFTLLAIGLRRGDWREALASRGGRLIAAYAVAFALVLVAVFSFTHEFSGARHVLPALPWLALLLALPLAQALPQGRPGRWLRGTLVTAVALACAAAWLAAAALAATLEPSQPNEAGATTRILAVTAAIAAVLAGTRMDARRTLAVMAALMLLSLPLCYVLLRPALPGAAQAVAAATANAPTPVLIVDRGPLGGVVCVLSGGTVHTTRKLDPPPAPGKFGTLVLPETALAPERYEDCEVSEIATDFGPIDPKVLIRALRQGEGKAYAQALRQPYMMVTCPVPSDP